MKIRKLLLCIGCLCIATTIKGQSYFSLEEALENPLNVRFLNLRGEDLKSLPEEIGKMTNMVELNLDNNSLTSLPKSIGKLVNLKYLELQRNDFVELPKEIGDLKSLEKLNLSHNDLENLPKEIGRLGNLKKLFLESNELHHLPMEISNLKKLKIIDLGDNKLESLPNSFSKLLNLERIYLRSNSFSELPEILCKLKGLTRLSIYDNKIKKLPESIKDLTNLKVLNVSVNFIEKLPQSIAKIENLEVLKVHYNELTSLPESIGDMDKLSTIYVNNNYISKIPGRIANNTNINVFGFVPFAKQISISTLGDIRKDLTQLNVKWYISNHGHYFQRTEKFKIEEVALIKNGEGDFNHNGIKDVWAEIYMSNDKKYYGIIELVNNVLRIVTYFDEGPYQRYEVQAVEDNIATAEVRGFEDSFHKASIKHGKDNLLQIVSDCNLDDMEDKSIFKPELNVFRESFVNLFFKYQYEEKYEKENHGIWATLIGCNDFSLEFDIWHSNIDETFDKTAALFDAFEFLESNTRFPSIVAQLEKKCLSLGEEGPLFNGDDTEDIRVPLKNDNEYLYIHRYTKNDYSYISVTYHQKAG